MGFRGALARSAARRGSGFAAASRVPSRHARVGGGAAANRDPGGAERGLLDGGLGAPLRLAHVAQDDAPIADDGGVARVERVEAHRVVEREVQRLDAGGLEQREEALVLGRRGGDVGASAVSQVAPLTLDGGGVAERRARVLYRDLAELPDLRLASDRGPP